MRALLLVLALALTFLEVFAYTEGESALPGGEMPGVDEDRIDEPPVAISAVKLSVVQWERGGTCFCGLNGSIYR